MSKKNYIILPIVLGCFAYLALTSYSSGITGQSTTGCGSGCHGNSVSPNTVISVSGLPAGGYTNGAVYSLTLSITNTTITGPNLRDGFDMTSTGGSFTAVAGTALNGANEIRHTTPKTVVSGTASWTFNWTAPVSGSATVNFNVAGNATNGDGSQSSLDKYNLFSTSVIKAPLPFSASATSTPILCNGGVSTITGSSLNGSAPIQYRLNGGSYQSSAVFINNLAGTYTVTARDATLATASTVITVNQPTAIAFNSASNINPICVGGTGSSSITATGGTGTKTYSITPLGPQTNTTGNFAGLTAQTYTVSVVDAAGCTKTTSITIVNPAPLVVTSNNVSGCQGNPIALSGTPAGGTFSVANPYTGPSTTYTYTYTNGLGCSATSSPSTITVTPVTSASIVTPTSTSYCQVFDHNVGTHFYSNSACELITSITSPSLGSTSSCINFLPGTPSWNGEPYANRVYSITPTIQPSSSATICLYYTPADLIAAGITTNSDISITKIGGDGILGGTGSVTEILNGDMTINNLSGGNKEVCFNVNSFSSFYLHSKNPNNIPLPIQLVSFKGQKLDNKNILSWETKQEINNNYFNLQYSHDGIHFETIAKIESQANDENRNSNLNYEFIHENSNSGYHFYKLEQVDLDGKSSYSDHVILFRSNETNTYSVYPNPSSGNFTIQTTTPTNVTVTDMNGKIIFEKLKMTQSEVSIQKSGLYLVRFTSMNGEQTVQKLVVN